MARGEFDELQVGYLPPLDMHILPRAVAQFQKSAPGVKVVLHDLGSDELCEKLRDGFLHLAVMIRPSGAELGTQIGADWALHHVPIVFVTALITPEEASDGRRIDGHRISAKPHTAAVLLRAVEESLPCCAEA